MSFLLADNNNLCVGLFDCLSLHRALVFCAPDCAIVKVVVVSVL